MWIFYCGWTLLYLSKQIIRSFSLPLFVSSPDSDPTELTSQWQISVPDNGNMTRDPIFRGKEIQGKTSRPLFYPGAIHGARVPPKIATRRRKSHRMQCRKAHRRHLSQPKTTKVRREAPNTSVEILSVRDIKTRGLCPLLPPRQEEARRILLYSILRHRTTVLFVHLCTIS